MDKRLLIEIFSVFCIQYTEKFTLGLFTTHPLLFSPTKNYYLYYHKFIHIEFLYKGQNIYRGTKKVPLIH